MMARTTYKEVYLLEPDSPFGQVINQEIDIEDNIAALNFHMETEIEKAAVAHDNGFSEHNLGLISTITRLKVKLQNENCPRFDASNYRQIPAMGIIAMEKWPGFSWLDITIAPDPGVAEAIYRVKADFSILVGITKDALKYRVNWNTTSDPAGNTDTYSEVQFSITELRTPIIANQHWYDFEASQDMVASIWKQIDFDKGVVSKDVVLYYYDETPTSPQMYAGTEGIENNIRLFRYGTNKQCQPYQVRAGIGLMQLYHTTGLLATTLAAAGPTVSDSPLLEIYHSYLRFPVDNFGAPYLYLSWTGGHNAIPEETGIYAMIHKLVAAKQTTITMEDNKVMQQEEDFATSEVIVQDEQTNSATTTTQESASKVENSTVNTITESDETSPADVPVNPPESSESTEQLLSTREKLIRSYQMAGNLTDAQKDSILASILRIENVLKGRGIKLDGFKG